MGQKYVNILYPNMHLHTGNLCCIVVPISHVLIFQTKNQILIIPTHFLLYVFIFITELNAIKCMEDAHYTKKNCHLCLQYPDNVSTTKKYTIK